MLGLHGCSQAFSGCRERAEATLLWRAGFSYPRSMGCRRVGSVVVVQGLNCSSVWIFPKQASNLCPLHWQGILNHWTTRKAPGIFSAMSTPRTVDFRLSVKSLTAHLGRAVYNWLIMAGCYRTPLETEFFLL